MQIRIVWDCPKKLSSLTHQLRKQTNKQSIFLGLDHVPGQADLLGSFLVPPSSVVVFDPTVPVLHNLVDKVSGSAQ